MHELRRLADASGEVFFFDRLWRFRAGVHELRRLADASGEDFFWPICFWADDCMEIFLIKFFFWADNCMEILFSADWPMKIFLGRCF